MTFSRDRLKSSIAIVRRTDTSASRCRENKREKSRAAICFSEAPSCPDRRGTAAATLCMADELLDAAAWPLPPGPDADETLSCAICYCETLEAQRAIGELGRPSTCRHAFCWDCILRWATEEANRCPICAAEIVALLRFRGLNLIEVRRTEHAEVEIDLTANDAAIAQDLANEEEERTEARLVASPTPPPAHSKCLLDRSNGVLERSGRSSCKRRAVMSLWPIEPVPWSEPYNGLRLLYNTYNSIRLFFLASVHAQP